MNKFKPGDKVRLIEMPIDGKFLTLKVGDVGTVVRTDGLWVSVNWVRNVHGHTCGMIDIPYGHGWNVRPGCLELVEVNEVHIKSDGKKTEAYIKKGERGSCVCSKSDEFDFPTGAAIALARAYGIDPAELAQRICKAVGKTPTKSAPRKSLMLRCGGCNYGEVGTLTKLVDCHGSPLCVGDVVSLYAEDTHGNYGDHIVVRERGNEFVMGIEISCRSGKIDPPWRATWQRSWKELEPGDIVCGMKVVEYKEDKA